MKISYAITVCNEYRELRELLETLLQYTLSEKREIVVLVDKPNSVSEIEKLAEEFTEKGIIFQWDKFEQDFAVWKNKLNALCTGDYIFQIDADEVPTSKLLRLLPPLLDLNPEIDLLGVPRENRVQGITDEDIEKWNWVQDDEGRINWPDIQWRIYRNTRDIFWKGVVHEIPAGDIKKYGTLPAVCYLKHYKSIQKQRSQNKLYDQLQHNSSIGS